MELKVVLGKIQHLLTSERVDFALIGGLAVGVLGYQRFTNDIDLLVDEADRDKVKTVLQTNGYKIFAENAEFLQLQGPCPIDIQFARRPLSKKMLADAQMIPRLGLKCLRAEDLIGLKIQAFTTNPKREYKEKADIQALIERLSADLDWDRIRQYADLFSKWDEIEAIRKKVSGD